MRFDPDPFCVNEPLVKPRRVQNAIAELSQDTQPQGPVLKPKRSSAADAPMLNPKFTPEPSPAITAFDVHGCPDRGLRPAESIDLPPSLLWLVNAGAKVIAGVVDLLGRRARHQAAASACHPACKGASPMKTYCGTRNDDVVVTVFEVEGDPRRLEAIPGFHGADTFNWGNHSRESAHLAMAILEDLRGRSFAVSWYLLFMSEVIAKLPRAGFTLSESAIHSLLGRIMAADDEVWEPSEGVSLNG
jgi:hypothetical protein